MHLSFFVIFGILLHNNFPTESRKVTPHGTVYEGFKVDVFRRITSHIIETNIVKKLGLCAFRCLKNLECVSFNFGNAVNGKHVCELLRTDKYKSRSSYVNSTDYHYFYPAPNKCMDPLSCQNNGFCYPDYDNNDFHCVCNGTTGMNCEIVYQDCSQLRSAGYTADGVYQINPDGQGSFPVYCDMTTDGGGWIVFQKHGKNSINFKRGWQDYKTGFGDLNDKFWLGFHKIYRLTKRQNTVLRVDLGDVFGEERHAVYSSFAIADESDFYRLNVSGYSGSAGDSLATASSPYHISNGQRFSTPDVDNDAFVNGVCADKGGWWYGWCSHSDLNGERRWWSFTHHTLENIEMKLK